MAPSATTTSPSITPISLTDETSVAIDHGVGNSTSAHGTATTLVGEALRKRVESIDFALCNPGDEDAFFVADLGEVYRQHLRWKLHLKRVKPFYGGIAPYRDKCIMLK